MGGSARECIRIRKPAEIVPESPRHLLIIRNPFDEAIRQRRTSTTHAKHGYVTGDVNARPSGVGHSIDNVAARVDKMDEAKEESDRF